MFTLSYRTNSVDLSTQYTLTDLIRGERKMGNKCSSHQEAKANGSSSSSSEKAQIISFQSKDEWSTYFENSKESDKLVSLKIIFYSYMYDYIHIYSSYKLVFANNNSDNFLFGMKMVIDFFASWCGPCKLMEPIIHDFAAKYTDVVFVKIDVDKLEVRTLFLLVPIFLKFSIFLE